MARPRFPAFLATLALCAASGAAQAPAGPGAWEQAPPAYLRIVERGDFSRYVDGRYLGHAYREGRLALARQAGGRFSGEYFLLGETLRDLRSEARELDRSGDIEFGLGPLGSLEGGLELALPALRGIPAAPPSALVPGLSWIAAGAYLLELQDETLALPLLVEYRAVGPAEGAGRASYLLKAKFALRSKGGRGPLLEASGSHELDIYLEAESGLPYLIRDRFDESYALASGGMERRAGFRLLFFESSLPADRVALAASLGAALGLDRPSEARAGEGPGAGPPGGGALLGAGPGPIQASPEEPPLADSPALREASAGLGAGLELDKAEAGLVLRILDFRFLPDSAEPLPEEAGRLDLVARALLAAEGRNFLVEGHSAGVGRPEGELGLSLLRARRIVEELVARGLGPSRFVYRGLGSSRPLASNAGEEGRARNRRVEITILD